MLPVAFLGDSHLVAGDETTPRLIEFLHRAPERFSRLVLLGDIFDLWLARAHLHEEHHRSVLEALSGARAAGLPVDYAVGNRDYGVESMAEAPLTRVEPELLRADSDDAPPPWLAEHGDLVNEDDRRYRAWRRFSRSPFVLGIALRMPAWIGVPGSQWLERRMRTTNLDYKRAFPTEQAVRRAERLFAETGARHLVLGHFHQELRFPAGPGEVHVLPDWKRSHRHAEWKPGGSSAGVMCFADSF